MSPTAGHFKYPVALTNRSVHEIGNPVRSPQRLLYEHLLTTLTVGEMCGRTCSQSAQQREISPRRSGN